VACNGCGRQYPRDPRLEVECPDCKAAVGSKCKRPSEHEAARTHVARERAVVIAGLMERVCPDAPQEQHRLTAEYWLENPFPGMPDEWTAAARLQGGLFA
jgi:hypothetical protein